MIKTPNAPNRIVNIVVSIARKFSFVDKKAVSRIGSLFLIVALLAQVILFGPIPRAKASASVTPPPVSAPPQPFTIGGAPTLTERIVSGAAGLLAFAAPAVKKEDAKTNLIEPPAPPPPPSAYDLGVARLSPKNATGGTNLYSQNFAWGTSLVSLPGRAGLNAGFGIGYNSLVWAKSSSSIVFNPDTNIVSPGFQFGFPVIEPAYYTGTTNAYSYLLVTPSGGRVEFRRIGTTSAYETADSSYAQIVTTGATYPDDPVSGITIKLTSTRRHTDELCVEG